MPVVKSTELLGSPEAAMLFTGKFAFGGAGADVVEQVPHAPINATVVCQYDGGAFDGAKAGFIKGEVTSVGVVTFKSTSATDNNTVAYIVTW